MQAASQPGTPTTADSSTTTTIASATLPPQMSACQEASSQHASTKRKRATAEGAATAREGRHLDAVLVDDLHVGADPCVFVDDALLYGAPRAQTNGEAARQERTLF